jgi:hypothetical protein
VSLAIQNRISPASVSVILRETIHAICDTMKDEFLPQPTQETWQKNEERFKAMWNCPNVCGSIDGKHVRVKSPPGSGTLFHNYKGFFSVVLLAISNADFQFTAVDIGAYGSESDGGILARSPIGQRLEEGQFEFPQPKKLSEAGPLLPYVLLGDDAFPLRNYMMKPYKGNFLDKESRVFNYRLSRARMTVENSFGILAARWRIFHSVIEARLDLAEKIILASVILHNFLTRQNDFNGITHDRVVNGQLVQGNWREINTTNNGIAGLSRQGSNNYSNSASKTRDDFRAYFMSDEGKVGWQDAHVDAGL